MATPAPDFKFINMSTGKNSRGDAEARIDAIRTILESERPTLAFVQEFTWVTLNKIVARNANLGNQYQLSKDKKSGQSGFIYDVTAIGCQPLDQERVRRLYDEARQAFTTDAAELERDPRMKSYFFELDRLCLRKAKSRGPPEFELLCACWHGHHMAENKTIYLEPNERKVILRTLLKFLLTIKVNCGNLPLMIGGDFNLESVYVHDVLLQITPNYLMSSPEEDSIMLWILSEDFEQTFNSYEYDGRMAAFDHRVLVRDLQLSSTAAWYKRLVNSQQSSPTGLQMLTATWHGDDAVYSDKAKERSLRETIRSLVKKIYKYPGLPTGEMDLAWVLKDAPKTRNTLTDDNILDTWILSNDESSLLKIKRDGQRLEKLNGSLLPRRPGQAVVPGRATNAVDIHLDIVNMILPRAEGITRVFERKQTMQSEEEYALFPGDETENQLRLLDMI